MVRLAAMLVFVATVAWPCTPSNTELRLPGGSVPENGPALAILLFWQRPLSVNLASPDGGVVTLTRDAGEPHWPMQEFPLAPGQLPRGSYRWLMPNAGGPPLPVGGFEVTAAAPLPTTKPVLQFQGERFPSMQCETNWTNAVKVDVAMSAEWTPWRDVLDARFETASGLQAPLTSAGVGKWYASLLPWEIGVVCGGGPTWAKLHLRVLGTGNDVVSDPLWFRCDCGVPCVPLASSPDGGFIEPIDSGVVDGGDGLVNDAGVGAMPPPRGCGCSSMPLGFMVLVPLLRRRR